MSHVLDILVKEGVGGGRRAEEGVEDCSMGLDSIPLRGYTALWWQNTRLSVAARATPSQHLDYQTQ